MSVEQFGVNPSERMAPAFREEDQDMAVELQPVVIGPPAYASPDPATASGRLVPVEEHPLNLSDDYGKSVLDVATSETVVGTYYYESSRTAEGVAPASDKPREEWVKADWQKQAKAYGLAQAGTKDDVKARVEAYEDELEADKDMKAAEWVEEVESAEDADALAAIRERYGASGATFSTVDEAFEKKQAEFDTSAGDNGNGDQQ